MAITLILDALKNAALTFATLFPIINPFGAAPIFLGLTRAYPASVRKLLARKIALYGFLLLGGSLALGSAVLTFFGISLSTVEIAGGLVLANTGWQLLNRERSDAEEPESITEATALQRAFYPLTLPLTVGPGCISVAIALGAHIRSQPNVAQIDRLVPFMGSLAGMVLVCITLSLCYEHADKLASILGPSGTNIVVRLSAFLLLAMGVQIIWNGFATSVTQLLTQVPAK
jgi:multiple antibiotic resistance protein